MNEQNFECLFYSISDVSVRVGTKTKMKYFVIEIHYTDLLKSKFVSSNYM